MYDQALRSRQPSPVDEQHLGEQQHENSAKNRSANERQLHELWKHDTAMEIGEFVYLVGSVSYTHLTLPTILLV